jgi:hypothetical protein
VRWERSLFDSALDALAAIPDWVPRGAIVLVAGLSAWLPVVAAWGVLDSLGGLR